MSNMAFLMMLRRMGRDDLAVDGFRSTFRDWAAERTTVAPEVAEAALAHTVTNKVEAAYRRSDLLEKRRVLMQQWALIAASKNQMRVLFSQTHNCDILPPSIFSYINERR